VYHEPEQTVVGVVEAVAPLESPFVRTAVASLVAYVTVAAFAQSSFAGCAQAAALHSKRANRRFEIRKVTFIIFRV
jgi:hypothetical protein